MEFQWGRTATSKSKWKGNDVVFRTYAPGSGKKPTQSTAAKEILDYRSAEKLDSFGGVLNKDFIDISFDTHEESVAFLNMCKELSWKCLVLESEKGFHTYWRNNGRIKTSGKDIVLAVGLQADIKKGNTYIPLKVEGVKRYPPIYDAGEYEQVPDELLSMRKNTVKLFGLTDGDGRNDTLFAYILELQRQHNFTPEIIRKILRNTNKFLFKDPLSEKELETILRDDSFKAPNFMEGRVFQHNLFGDYLIANDHVVLIRNELAVYKNGIYVTKKRMIEHAMIQRIPNIKRAVRTEVLSYLEGQVIDPVEPDPDYIAFNNGLYRISDNKPDDFELLSFTPDHIIMNKIPWDYVGKTYHKETDELLNRLTCDDPDVRAVVEEMIGYCFYSLNVLRKSFILIGSGRNGKSTFLAILESLLGKQDNVSALDLKELGDRFRTVELLNKLANIGDDIGDGFISDLSTFKKLVTGESLTVEYKGKDAFPINSYAKLIFSANQIPRMKDKTEAVTDRLVIIPFNAKFQPGTDGYKQSVKADFVGHPEVMSYLIWLGLKGLHRLLENQEFTYSQKIEDAKTDYNQRNNPVLAFIQDCEDEDYEIIGKWTGDVYMKYKIFCENNGFKVVSSIEFSKSINKFLGTYSKQKRSDGKNLKFFELKEENL